MTGIICLNKPEGITSFLAVAKVRRIIGEKKIGHTGTLDPMATGVLPLMIGGATRFLEILPSSEKEYKATFKLGFTTDTLDITGQVMSECEVNCGKEDVEKELEKFKGEIFQTPPMYSAIQKDGVRLYELARKGIEVDREKRRITIYKLDLTDSNESENEYQIVVKCSAGTYIRTLIDDVGKNLGCGAVMTKLCRISANSFTLDNSCTLEQLENHVEKGTLESVINQVDTTLLRYKKVVVSPAQSIRFSNGGSLFLDRVGKCKDIGLYRVYSPEMKFLGVGEVKKDSDQLSVKRVYVER